MSLLSGNEKSAPCQVSAPLNTPNLAQHSTLKPDPVAIRAFLEILKPQRIYAHVEGGNMDPCEVDVQNPEHLALVIDWAAQRNRASSNIYFQLNPARPGVLKKPSKGEVACGLYLHVDDDDRIYQGHGLPAGVPEPTYLIDSGNGLQPIWELAEPVQFSSLADAKSFELYNLQLRRHLRGIDGCHNVDRILRVAGSINWPSAAKQKRGCVPVMAKLLEHDPSRRYSIAQFAKAQAAPASSSEITVEGVEAWQEPATAYALTESETAALYRELDALGPRAHGKSTTFAAIKIIFHDFGCGLEEGADFLNSWNDGCGKPHSDWEINRQIRRCADSIQDTPVNDIGNARGWRRGLDCVRGMLANSPVYSASAAPANLNSASAAPAKLFSTVDDAIEDLFRASKLPLIPTGFAAVDELLGGGLAVGEPAVLVGGTGSGKSAFAVQIAAKVAESGPVIYASWELPARSLVARVASQRLSGLSWRDVLRGQATADVIRGAVPEGLLIMHRPSLDALRNLIVGVVQQTGKQPLVIVDYLQLISRLSTKEDARLATSEASEQARNLAQDLNVALLVVSATARGKDETISDAREKRPIALLGVGKESGDIEYDAGVLLVVGHTGGSDEIGRNISTITMAKSRFGQSAHFDFRFAGASGVWTEIGILDQSALTPDGKKLESIRAIVAEVARLPGMLNRTTTVANSGIARGVGLAIIRELLAAGHLGEGGKGRPKLFVTGDCPAEYLEGGAE